MNHIVCKNLNEYIAREDLTPRGFAMKYGLNVSTISRIVRGDGGINITTIENIANAMGIPVELLVCDRSKKLDGLVPGIANANVYERICNYDNEKMSRIIGYMDRMDEEK